MKRQHLPSKQAYLYVLECEDANRYVKIGITVEDIASRHTQLQIGCPYALRLAAVFAVHSEIYKMEQRIHTLLAEYRIRGEWFRLSAAQAVHLIAEQIFPAFASPQKSVAPINSRPSKIVELMQQMDVSLSRISRELHIPKSSLHNYLTGKGRLDEQVVQKIGLYLNRN